MSFKSSVESSKNNLDSENEKIYVTQYKAYQNELDEINESNSKLLGQKDDINIEIGELLLFKKFVEDKKNYITSKGSIYYEYLVYEKEINVASNKEDGDVSSITNNKLIDINQRIERKSSELKLINVVSTQGITSKYLGQTEQIIYELEKQKKN